MVEDGGDNHGLQKTKLKDSRRTIRDMAPLGFVYS